MNNKTPVGLSEPFLPGERLVPGSQASLNLLGLSGLEPPTSRLSGVRSNRLSYKPSQKYNSSKKLIAIVETKRFELSTPCLQGRCSPS